MDSMELTTAGETEVGIEAGDDGADLLAGLSAGQVSAFEVLTTGGTVSAAARAAGKSRETIYQWLSAGHRFAIAYEQWKSSIAETSRTRLLMIGEAATVQVARAIHQGDTRAALAVVKGMGLMSPPPVGPSLTQAAARKKELEVQKAERMEAEAAAGAISFKDLVNVEGFEKEMREAEERMSGE
jgi:hypothetical protein